MASNMNRWDPFREMVSLRDAMDTLFESALIRPNGVTEGYSGGSQGSLSNRLPVDVLETEDSFIVRATVPGMNPEDLNVTVTDNVLTIQGEIKPDEQREGVRYHLRERGWGKFVRHLELPTQLEANRAQSDFANGVLTLTLPKVEAAKPKRITIHASGPRTIEGQGRQAQLGSGKR